MDGRRGYPDDEQQRWNDDDRGFGEGSWRDGGYRAPEPRDSGPDRGAEPSFNGFTTGGDREQRWSDEQAEQPSWNSSARPLPADARRRQNDEPPQRAYAGPATGELPRTGPAEARPPIGEPVPPPLPMPDAMPDGAAGLNAPTGLMPPIAPRDDMRRPGGAPAGEGVYRTRRPALALLYGVLTAVFEIGALRIFFDSMFSGDLVISGIVSGMLLIAGLPLLAAGLYSATTGAVRPEGPGGWLRPPAVYLVVGLGLLLAAGFAAG
ncbi:hypothetical protein [Asanoa iriomotensis]|uniref:hypothetical protein n=1 Tax=Asanoa iriomotensis TaxID=234613 RepID=UPI001942CA46|nr:hypothetical protein [Asanoa iriomotensis]